MINDESSDVAPLFARAERLIGRGLIDAAEPFVEELRAKLPESADAIRLQLLITIQREEWEVALELLNALVSKVPEDAAGHGDRGFVLIELGREAEAEEALTAALRLEPTMIAPAIHLSSILAARGAQSEAREKLEASLCAHPKNKHLLLALAKLHFETEEYEATLHIYESLVEIDARQSDYHYGLGVSCSRLADHHRALDCLRACLSLEPEHVQAKLELGYAHFALRQFDQAKSAFSELAQCQPDFAAAWSGLGVAYRGLAQFEQALEAHQRALLLDPNDPNLHGNVGAALAALGRGDEAMRAYEAALRLEPTHAGALFNASLGELTEENFEAGWQGYWHRFEAGIVPPHNVMRALPRWDGSPLNGRSIYVYAEQGFGDTIQFIRFVPRLREFGAARVVLAVQDKLVELVGDVAQADVVGALDSSWDGCEVCVPLLDLPLHLGIGNNQSPGTIPYLTRASEEVSHWQERLGENSDLKVGLVWSGRATHLNNIRRSVGFSRLTSLFDVSGVRFFGVQKGPSESEISGEFAAFEDLSPVFDSFVDNAALFGALDLLITVDTAPVHLMGAVGGEAWLLLSHEADWRWGKERETSQWYHSVKLFRQPEEGDWDSVLKRVRAALIERSVGQGRD